MKNNPILARTSATLVALLGLFSAPSSLAANRKQPDVIVYVESNRADRNSILAYTRDPQGKLKYFDEYPTEGKGVFDASLALGPFDSDQNLIVNAEHTLLFAVNSGSDSIAVFHIGADGALTAVIGSPFWSGGANPVSIGLAKETLIVVNKAMDPARPNSNQPSYASFNVTPQGGLGKPISIIQAPVGSSVSQAAISSGKRLAFDAQFFAGNLQSLVVEADGTLTPADREPLPDSEFAGSNAPHLPLGLAAHPSQPILYVGLVTINRLAVYTYDALGQLTFVRSVADSGAAPCWVKTNSRGTRAYVSNTGDTSIAVFDTTDPFNPVEIQKLELRGLGSSFQIELDPQEEYLYVVTQRASAATPLGRGNTLHALKIKANTGELNETGAAPETLNLPAGTRPQGLATIQLF